MSIRYYFDVHVRRAVAEGLRLRGVDVLTAQEDGTAALKIRNFSIGLTYSDGCYSLRMMTS